MSAPGYWDALESVSLSLRESGFAVLAARVAEARALLEAPPQAPVLRAISVLQDVLTDIEDWEDKALAEAVTDARRGLLMMLEAEKLKRAANPVPRVVASGVGGFGDAEQ